MKQMKLIILFVVLMNFVGIKAFAFSPVYKYDIIMKNDDGVTIYYKWINNKTELAVYYEYSYEGETYSPYSGNIVIPKFIEYSGKTYNVTSIGEHAFYGCSGLTSITIPNSMTSIGNYAFSGCSSLTSVTIPNSVTDIGTLAFNGCSSLTSVTIPNSVASIGQWAFSYTGWYQNQANGLLYLDKWLIGYKGDSPVGELKIVEGTKGIAEHAFSGCSGLTSVTIPNSVTFISSYAFSGCSGLTSVTIPNSVTDIGSYAFYGCSGLTSVSIPNSVTSIGSDAFAYCSGLTSVTIPNSVTSIGSDAFHGTAWYNNQPDGLVYAGKVAYKYKGDMPENISVTIKDGTLGIAGYAFYYCSGLTSVTIPNSVTSIGNYAFSGCNGLTKIISEIENPFSISDNAFYYYDKDIYASATLVVPPGKKSVYQNTDGWNLFSNIVEAELIGYEFGSSGIRYKIGENNTVSVTRANYSGDVVIPSSVVYHGKTYSVTSIGNGAFYGCNGLTSVTIPNSVTSIGDDAFCCCGDLTSVTIPNGVTSIGSYTFEYCSGLTSVTIPNSVTSIGKMAFSGCIGLTSFTIPNSVTSFGNGVFGGCSGMKTVISEIENPFAIDNSVFSGVLSNSTLIVPKGKKSIYQSTAGWNQFANIAESSGKCGANVYYSYNAETHTLTISGEGEMWGWQLMEIDDRPWRSFYKNIRSIVINSGVTSIGNWAFAEFISLTSVTIPSSVTTIYDCAFLGCSGLTSVTIPNGVIMIEDDDWGGAFGNCTGLTSIIIPKSVTSVGSNAFRGCSGLTSIQVENGNQKYDSRDNCNAIIETSSNTLISGCKNTIIPNSVTSIGYQAFYGCSGLTSVTIPNCVTSIGSQAFSGCSGLTSVTIGSGVTSIGNMAFNGTAWYNNQANGLLYLDKWLLGCKGDKPVGEIKIAEDTKGIADYAFSICSGLTSVTIGNCVTSIGRQAFGGCSGLTSVTIPNCVTSIGSQAFSDCSGLTSVTIGNSVTSIGYQAFYGCSGLTSVTIPNSVTSINYTFSGCSGLTKIISEIENPFSISDFYCYDKDIYASATLVVPPGKKSIYQNTDGWKQFSNIVEAELIGYEFESGGIRYRIGQNNTVSVISKKGGYYSGDVVIPSSVVYHGKTYSVTSIGTWAFFGCNNLTSVTIPNSVTTIGDMAFQDCGLTSITIPNSVTRIGLEAFKWCDLTSVTIPNSVTFIGGEAFKYCIGLTSVTIPNSLTSIVNGAFSYCRGLTSVTIPNSVTSIGDDAFWGCSGLTSVIVGKGIQSIGNDVFYNCSNLQEMILSQTAYENGIPASVTKFTTYSNNPMRVVVTSKGATSATMKIYPMDDSGNTNEDNYYTVTMQGLTPGQYIKWKLDDENYGIISEKTSALTLTTQPAQPTSTTKARLTAMVNEADDDQRYGFEWLRNDAPDNMTPNRVSTPLYDGKIIGTLSGLNPDIYYKYRPYYKADDGTMLRGEWVVFLTGDANVFFEPVTHTKEVVEVTTVSAQLAGVWIEGTEDIEEKGFEYWVVAGSSTRTIGKDVKKVIVGDNQTTITLNSLYSGTEYGYRSYVKTASGTTYGEEKTFKTISDGKVRGDVNGDGVVNETDAYDVASFIMGKTPKGFNKDAADLNKDDKVNVADIVLINNIIKKNR